MTRTTAIFLNAMLCAVTTGAIATPAAAVEHDGGLWFTLNLKTPVQERVNASLIIQPRIDHDVGRVERVVVRPAIHFRWKPGLTLTQGYDAHVIDAPRGALEHRLWQEIGGGRALGARTRLLYSLRLEERFFDSVEGVVLRPRFLIGALYRIAPGWSLRLTNEAFVNATRPDGFGGQTFDQNRVIAGVVRKLSASASALVGYQLQLINRATEDLYLHQAFLGLTYRF